MSNECRLEEYRPSGTTGTGEIGREAIDETRR